MATVDNLIIKVLFDENAARQSAQKIESIIDGLAKNIGSALTAVFSADYLKNITTNFAQVGSSLQFFSQKTGESVPKLQAWQQAVKRMGGTTEGFNASLNNLYQGMQDFATTGGGAVGGMLAGIGIKLADSNGKLKKTTDIYRELAEVVTTKFPKNQQQYILKQLGIDDALARVIMQGKAALDEQLKSMEKQGILSDEQSKKAVVLKQHIDDLTQRWDYLKLKLGGELSPTMLRLIDIFTQFTEVQLPAIVHGLGLTDEQFAKILVSVVALVGAAAGIRLVATAFKLIGAGVMTIITPLTKLASLMGDIIALGARFSAIFALLTPGTLDDPEKASAGEKSYQSKLQKAMVAAGAKPTTTASGKVGGYPLAAILDGIENIETHHDPKQTNTGNGAYGFMQVRPNWLKRTLLQEGMADGNLSPEELGQRATDPAKGREYGKIMFLNDLKNTHGNAEAAARMYSSGHYGMNAILAAANPQLLQSGAGGGGNTGGDTTVNIDSVSLPGVKDATGFVDQLANFTDPMNLTRTQNSFQTGKMS